jgi:hypothetical protein
VTLAKRCDAPPPSSPCYGSMGLSGLHCLDRLQAAGAKMLTVHGRQPHARDHQGPASFEAIRGQWIWTAFHRLHLC